MRIINITLLLLQIALFTGLLIYYERDPLYKCPCKRYNVFFPIAKSSGFMINVNVFLIFIVSNKIWKRWLYYNSITLRKLHIFIFSCISIFSSIHVVSHIVNFTKRRLNSILGTLVTGIILSVLIILFVILAKYKSWLHTHYGQFMKFHSVLLLVFIIVLSIHGSFCAISYSVDKCPKATSWIWIICGLGLYIINAGLNLNKGILFHQIVEHDFVSQDILRIALDKSCQEWIGKTVYILIPSISKFEWHPFTIADRNSVYIKRRGDWTTRLFEKLNGNRVNFLMLTSGPYKTFPDIRLQNGNSLVLIATGIGITSFLGKITSLSLITKLYVIIIVKKIDDITWLKNVFLDNKNIKFLVYITSECTQSEFIEQENVYYKRGRPDFNDIFDNVLIENMFIDRKKIDFYFSGCETVYNKIKSIGKKYDTFRILYI